MAKKKLTRKQLEKKMTPKQLKKLEAHYGMGVTGEIGSRAYRGLPRKRKKK